MSQKTPLPRYIILATDDQGDVFECFTWTRLPEAGVARARQEAERFGRTDLTDFRAVQI